jgi:hypothetical protein
MSGRGKTSSTRVEEVSGERARAPKSPVRAVAHKVKSDASPRSTPRAHCAGITKAGGQCPMPKVYGDFCLFHHPDKERARIARSRGGSRRAIFDPDKLKKFEPPKTVEDVIAVVGQLAQEVHQCACDPKQASCIGGLLHVLVDALEVAEQGALLRSLEQKAGLLSPMDRLRDPETHRFLPTPKGELQ